MISRHLGIELAPYLNINYELTWDEARQRIGTAQAEYRLFHIAWHGFGYRAIAAERYAQAYCKLPQYGSAGHEGDFQDDFNLVGFLFSSCSAVDCLAFAAFALAARLNPKAFPISKAGQLAVTRTAVADRFAEKWPNAPLTSVLGGLRDDQSVQFLFQVRDVATHRGVFPRTQYVYLGDTKSPSNVTIPSKAKDLPDAWVSDF